MSCDKREEYTPTTPGSSNTPNATNLDDIIIPTTFDWSSSLKGRLGVSLNANASLKTNGQPINLVDSAGRILAHSAIFNNEAEFVYNVPQNGHELYIEYPNTGESFLITGEENVVMNVGNLDRTIERDSTQNPGKKGKMASFKTSADVVVNGDFSVNDIGSNTSGDYVLRTPGKWYEATSDGAWDSNSGGRYESTDKSDWYVLIQSIAAASNAAYTGSFRYGGSSSKISGYVDYYDASSNYIGYKSFSESGGSASISGTTPSNCAFVQIYITQKDKKWLDDVVLDVATPILDADNDGVVDTQDDYPNDPTRAYTSSFPSIGYQTLAFEDLWPAKGDFDFNDMVVSNQVVYSANANNEWVDATFTISLDAVGSGFSNGLAIVFTDANKQALGTPIITSVSGDASLDPSVTNGIVVFHSVYAAQSQFYQNNGVGPNLTADVFTFTVTFNSNAGTAAIIPDTYIYRTDNRGNEVHLDGFSGSMAANAALNGTIDDVGGTYNTVNGLPWALEIVTDNKTFKHPLEKNDIVTAYPDFQVWAESNGTTNTDWIDNFVLSLVF